jgi:hypothetical protein
MLILNSVDELLEHIKDVQSSVKSLSSDSLMSMSNFIQKNNIEIDDDLSTAFQYQDIITQQLDASLEAIDSMRQSIAIFLHAFKSDEDLANGSLMKLQEKLNSALEEAKEKKARFSGKSNGDVSENDEIEFF